MTTGFRVQHRGRYEIITIPGLLQVLRAFAHFACFDLMICIITSFGLLEMMAGFRVQGWRPLESAAAIRCPGAIDLPLFQLTITALMEVRSTEHRAWPSPTRTVVLVTSSPSHRRDCTQRPVAGQGDLSCGGPRAPRRHRFRAPELRAARQVGPCIFSPGRSCRASIAASRTGYWDATGAEAAVTRVIE